MAYNFIQNAASRLFRLNLPYVAAGGSNLDEQENIGWIPLSASQQPLTRWQQDRMMEISAMLYRRNPIGRRVVEIIKAFVVGEGIHVSSDNPAVNEVINKFWKDRRNNTDSTIRKRVVSLSTYGEALWPVYVNEYDGSCVLGHNSPLIIDNVLPNQRNNFEAEVVITKKGQRPDMNKIGSLAEFGSTSLAGIPMIDVPPQVLQVVKLNTDTDADDFNMYHGDVFYFTINGVMDDLRGLSDIYTIGDWLDVYDKFLFNRAEKQGYMNQWIWDITLEGMNEAQQEAWFAKQLVREQKGRSGRMFVHNEKVERKAVSPDLRSDDAQTDAQSFMQMIWGGTGLSSQAFGDPGGFGRQASNDMNEWVFHTLADRQVEIKNMILYVLGFVVDQAIIHGKLKTEDRDAPIKVFMPKISVRDLQRVTQSLRNVGQFISQAFRANTEFEFDDETRKRIQDTIKFLLDHIDLSSSPEVLVDLDSQDEVDPSHYVVSRNGRN